MWFFLVGCQQPFSWQNQPRLSSVGVATIGCVQWCSAHLQLSQSGDREWQEKWLYSWHKKQLVRWPHLRPLLRIIEQLLHSSQASLGSSFDHLQYLFLYTTSNQKPEAREWSYSLRVYVPTWNRKHRQEMLGEAYVDIPCITFQTV